MSQNGTKVVDEAQALATALHVAETVKDESHLIIVLTQASYDLIKEVVDRATARGLDSGFDHWLNDSIKTGTVARLRTWNDRDYVTLFKQAAAGNVVAKHKLAKLLKMDVTSPAQ